MTEEDLEKVISTLIRDLKALKMEWVLTEYFETIRAGKVQEKSAKYEYWNEEKQDYRTVGKSKKVTETVPYSRKEQAILLLDSIENASVIPHRVVNEINKGVSELFPTSKISGIKFRPDLESVAGVEGGEEFLPEEFQEYVVDFESEVKKNDEIEQLQQACSKLRSAIEE